MKSTKIRENKNLPLMAEIGDSGLKRSCGLIDEEFHPKLVGDKGRKIIREMMDNEVVVGASLWIIEAICRQVTWTVEEAESDSADKTQAAVLLDQAFRDMERPWKSIVADALSMIPFGWALLEPTYKIRRGPEYAEPRLRSNFSDGLYGWRDWGLRAQESLYKWEFNGDGAVVGMWQQPPSTYDLRAIPLDRAILLNVRQRHGSPEGVSLLRPAYVPYYFAKRLRDIEAIGIERNIAGMPKMEVPLSVAHAKAGTAEAAVLAKYLEFVKKIRMDAYYGAVLPAEDLPDGKKSGYRLSLLSSSGRSFADTSPIIERYEKRIAMALETEYKFLGMDRIGALSTSSDKTGMFAYVVEALLDIIEDAANMIAIPRLMTINGFAPDAFPHWYHGEVSRRAITELFGAVTSAVTSGAMEAADDIDDFLRAQLDLRPRKGLRYDAALEDGASKHDLAVPEETKGQLALPLQEKTADEVDIEIPEEHEPERPFITADDIAEQLGVPRNTVLNALRSGKMPGAKIGNKWRVSRESFLQFMQAP